MWIGVINFVAFISLGGVYQHDKEELSLVGRAQRVCRFTNSTRHPSLVRRNDMRPVNSNLVLNGVKKWLPPKWFLRATILLKLSPLKQKE